MLGLPVFGITVGGFFLFMIALANAALVSIPGERLYTVKRGLEKAQTSLSLNEVQRSKLELEFVGRRVDELKQLGRQGDSNDAHVASVRDAASTVQSAQKQLQDIAYRVKSLPRKQKDELAQIIKDKTQAVQNAVVDLPQSIKTDVIRELGDANVKVGEDKAVTSQSDTKGSENQGAKVEEKPKESQDNTFQAPTDIKNPRSNSRFQK